MGAALAFLRRDWLVWVSYRAAVFQQYLGLALMIILVYTLGSNFTGDISPRSFLLRAQDAALVPDRAGDYVAFALIGLALTDIFISGLSGIPKAIRNGQFSGTTETVLLSPIRNWEFVFGSGMFSFVQSVLRGALLLGFGYFVLGYWRGANLYAAAVILLPGFLALVALGLMSASFILIFKQGDPISLGFAGLSIILGGTLLPTNALPDWVQPAVLLHPMSHALSGMRLAFAGAGMEAVVPQMLVLVGYAVVLMPLGLLMFHLALGKARKMGTLGHY